MYTCKVIPENATVPAPVQQALDAVANIPGVRPLMRQFTQVTERYGLDELRTDDDVDAAEIRWQAVEYILRCVAMDALRRINMDPHVADSWRFTVS